MYVQIYKCVLSFLPNSCLSVCFPVILLPVCLLPCHTLACLTDCLPASLSYSCLFACLPNFLPLYLPNCLLACHTLPCLPVCFPVILLPVCLPACLLVCLSVFLLASFLVYKCTLVYRTNGLYIRINLILALFVQDTWFIELGGVVVIWWVPLI